MITITYSHYPFTNTIRETAKEQPISTYFVPTEHGRLTVFGCYQPYRI